MDKIVAGLERNYVAGEWLGVNGEYVTVKNPATEKVIGKVPSSDKKTIETAIDAAVTAFASWKKSELNVRYDILMKWYELILANKGDIAKLMTYEQGKPISQAEAEVEYGASFVKWFASQAINLKDALRPSTDHSQYRISIKEPVGVVAAITPWNFPMAMITRKLAPALAAGCSVILKPSEETPYSGIYQAKLLDEAGLPAGVLNLVTCKDPNLFCDVISADFRVRKLSFTGSTKVGKIIYGKSDSTLKKLSLELGGNAPYIIFEDVDLDKVTNELITIKKRSGGQSCTSPNRIFIHEDIYDTLTAKIAKEFTKCKVGDGAKEGTDIGPLINHEAVKKVDELVQGAISDGAKLLCGGEYQKQYYDSTVLRDCTSKMSIFKNEIFGPVIACFKFSTTEEALELANDTEYGLMSYIYSNDIKRANLCAKELDFGMVAVNCSAAATADVPFSGRRASGFGVEGSDLGIEEFLNVKYINLNF